MDDIKLQGYQERDELGPCWAINHRFHYSYYDPLIHTFIYYHLIFSLSVCHWITWCISTNEDRSKDLAGKTHGNSHGIIVHLRKNRVNVAITQHQLHPVRVPCRTLQGPGQRVAMFFLRWHPSCYGFCWLITTTVEFLEPQNCAHVAAPVIGWTITGLGYLQNTLL